MSLTTSTPSQAGSWARKQVNSPHDSDQEERHRGIVAGLEDVVAGRTVPHSQVKEWAEKLSQEACNEPDDANHPP